MFLKLNKRLFSSKVPESLNYYKGLIKDSEFLMEELFPQKFENSEQFKDYFNIPKISKNIKLSGHKLIDSMNAGTLTPGWDMLSRGGKKWRPVFGLILSKLMNVKIGDIERNKNLYKMLYLTELIHNASLIIDDVEDKSEQRRNQPCVNIKYGEDIAINAGISMLYFPIHYINNNINDINLKASLLSIYIEEMSAIHIGQGWDIEMKVKNRIPNVSNYEDVVIFKTGVCPRLIVKLITTIQDVKDEIIYQQLIDIADHISVAFQIKDDLLNIEDSNLAKGKGFLGEDIYEGKLTLMVLHSLNNKANSDKLKEILMLKSKDKNTINEAIEILRGNGSIKYAENIMEQHVLKVTNICSDMSKKTNINSNAALDMVDLVNYLIGRNI